MNVSSFEIQIIDTLESDRTQILERTSFSNPKLTYSGQQNKTFPFFASKLTFDMLVTTNDASVFSHLFTGDENRYQVKLLGTIGGTEVQQLMWQGFLLAEQFEEPFVHSNFFVSFVATEGVALLKQKTLSETYYTDNKNIIEILHACLALTGLSQPIYFAPPLQNAGFNLDFANLIADTSSYALENKATAYDVLFYVLKSSGCRLFSYNGTWYVIGLNRFKDDVISATSYDVLTDQGVLPDGEAVVINRSFLRNYFRKGAVINLLPPLQKSTINWSHNNQESLVPTDLVTHDPANLDTDTTDRTPKYWLITTDASLTISVFVSFTNSFPPFTPVLPLDGDYFGALKIREDFREQNGPFFSIEGSVSSISNFDNNYAYVTNSFYVDGSTDLERFANLELSWFVPLINNNDDTVEAVNTAIGNLTFNYKNFAILRSDYKNDSLTDAEVYVSDNANFPFSLSVNEKDFSGLGNTSVLEGVLSSQKVLLSKSGWYTFVLYPVVANANLENKKIVTRLSFTLTEPSIEETVLEQNINYTTEFSQNIFHSGTQNSQSPQRFLFSQDVSTSIVNGVDPERTYTITKRFYTKESVLQNLSVVEKITVGLEPKDYFNLKNGYQLNKEQGSTTVIAPFFYQLLDSEPDGKVLVQYQNEGSSQVNFIEQNDSLSLAQDFNYSEYWLDKWKRYDTEESATYASILNRMYIDLTKSPLYNIEGVYNLLVSPLDLVVLSYNGERKYTPTRIRMDLDQNTTGLSILEIKQELTDYPDDNDQENTPPSNVNISIASEFAYPSIFEQDILKINTSYVIQNITDISASITAQQYSGDPSLAGSTPTNTSQEGTITNSEGVFSFNFENFNENTSGWYQIQVVQGDFESNTQNVQVKTFWEIVEENGISRHTFPYLSINTSLSLNADERAYDLQILELGNNTYTSFDETIREITGFDSNGFAVFDESTAITTTKTINSLPEEETINFTTLGLDMSSGKMYGVTVNVSGISPMGGPVGFVF